MKKLFRNVLLPALTAFACAIQQNSGTLAGFFSKAGLAGREAGRRLRKIILFVPVLIQQNRRAALDLSTRVRLITASISKVKYIRSKR